MGVLLAACSSLPLIAWQRRQLGIFVGTATASVLLAGLGYAVGLLLGPALALYFLAASRDSSTPWRWHTTALVIIMFASYLVATTGAQQTFPGVEFLHTGLAWAAAWFAGERTRLRREQLADLRQRAARAEREVARERLLAVAEERTRIARDLHDSAGHAISVIGVRAGAARLRHHENPDRSLRALEAIEELARETVEDIDQIVGTLRHRDLGVEAVDAPPGLASLDTLIAQQCAAGLEVTCDTAGTLHPLGGAADQAAYRILQEALTNAARHGTGKACVELVFGCDVLDLVVTNPAVVDEATRSRVGHGLIGMQERANLVGGRLEAGAVKGTFAVRASIPYGTHRS